MRALRFIPALVGGLLLLSLAIGGAVWSFCRVTVPADKCLVLIRKSGKPLPPGESIAGPGFKGIQREALGPGRYFFNPIATEWELHDLVTISPGDPGTWDEAYDLHDPDYQSPELKGRWPEIGVLVSRVGKSSPAGLDSVVGPGFQGIQREVLTPGTYRINPYVYEVKKHKATIVPFGCVGVVTSRQGDSPGVEMIEDISVGPDGKTVKGEPKAVQKLAAPGQRGVLERVLQPGIHYLNPYLYETQIVWVGYNLMSQVSTTANKEATISFPSKDGFSIDVDVTVVWGLRPEHTPEMISRIGQADRIKQIILSQLRSIGRNVGSNFLSTDFIQGERRAVYQHDVTESLREVCKKRDIEILIALIQNVEVRGGSGQKVTDTDLKHTIQDGYIAREQELTKQIQTEAERVKAELEAATAAIPVAREKVTSETRKKVAELLADGEKKAAEIDAQRDLEVATIDRQMADLEAETTRLLGRAKAQVDELKNKAEADGKRMMVEAFGSGRAYNLYTFAEKFEPETIRLFYAGDGTFWTDMNRLQDAAAIELLRGATNDSKAAEPAAKPK
ncbi:MAG: hypothetical protein HZB38_13205 [Planctomycetes bacterium]|nr:hypothetical protein [Planctomycetota bacterium]